MLKKHVLVYVILLFAIVIFNTHIDASDAKTDKLREICAKLNVHEKASNVYDIVATEKYQALPVIKHFTASYSPTCIVLELKKQRMILNIKDKIFTTIQQNSSTWSLVKHLNGDACRLGLQNLPSGHLVHQLSYAIGQYSIKDMLEHSSLVVLSQSTSGDSAILKFATDMPLNTGMANAKIDSTITYNYTHILKVSHEFIPVGLNDKHIIETEYQISNQNSPVEGLKIKVSTYISNTRVLQGTTAYVFNRVQTDLLSCDLSTYGIVAPSDDVYEDRGFNWPLWGGLGLFCLVLSATIAFIVRRRNRMKAEG